MTDISISTLYNQATGYPKKTTTGSLAFTGTAQNYPDALTGGKSYLVQATSMCHVSFTGTATAADPPIFAFVPYVVHLPADVASFTASVIRNAANGTIWISEIVPDRV